MSEIKQVKIGTGTPYEINSKYIQDDSGNPKSWSDITSLIRKGTSIEVLEELPSLSTDQNKKDAYTNYAGDIILIADATSTAGTYIEYVGITGKIPSTADEDNAIMSWEQIGSTTVDLSNYLKKNTNYAGAAKSAGAHTHTVTVPTISIDKTMKLGITRDTDVAVGPNGTETFIKSYSGATSKLVTTTVTGVSGSTTASKATAGTAFNVLDGVSIAENSSTATGRVQYVKSISNLSLGGTTTFNTDAMKASVDSNGVLTLAAAGTGTVTLNPTVTTKHLSVSGNEKSITPYAFTDVTVPTAASAATTVATGSLNANGTGASVMTGLGTASTDTALKGVKVTTQPVFSINEATTNEGPVNEHTTTGTNSATTSESGTHTHNVEAES